MAKKEKSVDFDYSVDQPQYEDESLAYYGLQRKEEREALAENPTRKVGRPAYIPSQIHYEVVRALCLYGAPHDVIASHIGITPKTLRKYYPELLANCAEDKIGSVETSLFLAATVKGDVRAMQYYLDNHAKHKYNKTPIPVEPEDEDNDDILSIIADNVPD